MEAKNCLAIWSIYRSPTDYPGLFVARKWLSSNGGEPTAEVKVADTLQGVRDMLPRDLYCLPRALEDDPKIVESWF